MAITLRSTLGLNTGAAFLRDAQFWYALAAAPLVLLCMNWLTPAWSAGIRYDILTVCLLVMWQPVIEELLFRGIIQGRLHDMPLGRLHMLGLSAANCMTTVLFVAAHLLHHSDAWALAVAAPSLIFGYFRDRHRQIYPAVMLHAAYNACYLLFGMMNNR